VCGHVCSVRNVSLQVVQCDVCYVGIIATIPCPLTTEYPLHTLPCIHILILPAHNWVCLVLGICLCMHSGQLLDQPSIRSGWVYLHIHNIYTTSTLTSTHTYTHTRTRMHTHLLRFLISSRHCSARSTSSGAATESTPVGTCVQMHVHMGRYMCEDGHFTYTHLKTYIHTHTHTHTHTHKHTCESFFSQQGARTRLDCPVARHEVNSCVSFNGVSLGQHDVSQLHIHVSVCVCVCVCECEREHSRVIVV
jgi:hypothetical protein